MCENMNCFFNDFIFNDETHKVNIIWKNGDPLFEANQIGSILGLVNIRQAISKFPSNLKIVCKADTPGGLQNKTFFTEQGLYKLLFTSRKPVAEIFQYWVTSIIKNIRKTGQYGLEELKKAKQEAALAKQDAMRADHKAIMDRFDHKYLVYIAFIKNIGDKQLIKIGSTKMIKQRYPQLCEQFGSLTFLNAYECEANEQFEKYLHKHQDIVKCKYTEPIHNGHRSSEVFLMNSEEISKVYRIITANVYKYKTNFNQEAINKVVVNELKSEVKSEVTAAIMEELKKTPDEIIIDRSSHMPRKFSNGNKVQIYKEDGKTLIKTYATLKDAETDSALNSPTKERIKNAIAHSSLYRGYRWAHLERTLQDNTVQDIGDTVATKEINIGYVAMLNLNKDKIMEVFPNAKSASENRHFKNGAAISKAIKIGSQSGGHYFQMWFDCNESLKKDYLAENDLPPPTQTKNAYVVEQLHPVNKSVVKTFHSVTSITNELRCGRKGILDAIQNDHNFRGFLWRKK